MQFGIPLAVVTFAAKISSFSLQNIFKTHLVYSLNNFSANLALHHNFDSSAALKMNPPRALPKVLRSKYNIREYFTLQYVAQHVVSKLKHTSRNKETR